MSRLRLALGAATVALAALLAAGCAGEKSYKVTEADVRLSLAADASLVVTERLSFDFDGSFEGAYRDIPLLDGERITEIRVWEGARRYEPGGNVALGSTDRPGVFGATSLPGGARIVWHYRAEDEQRTFTISYRALGVVEAYDDVLDVDWRAWGSQWDFDLESLNARLRAPGLNPADPAYRVWGNPLSVDPGTERGRGVARLIAADVPDHQSVSLRVTVPRRPGQDVSGAQPRAGDGLERIVAAEEEAEDEFNSAFNRFKRWVADNAVLLALLVAGIALGALAVMRFLAREHPTSVPSHLPELPDDATPALAYGLAHEGGDSTETVLATLLDLVERDYYTARQATTADEKLDLALAKNGGRPPAAALERHEQEVLEFFDELLGPEEVPMSVMKDRIPEHSATWRGRWQEMTSALDRADEGELDWDRSLNPARWLLALLLVPVFAGIALIDFDVDETWIAPAAIGVLSFLIVVFSSAKKLKRLSPQSGERVARWRAFERWTRDFPTLEDDPPATLELWKKILVFGVAFGTAERMIESGRIPAPVVESSSGTWSYYAFSGSLNHSSLDAGDFGSGFSSQVAPESSGGGVSGGGGGSSGGGGGGAW